MSLATIWGAKRFLPYVAIAGAVAWAVYERDGWQRAERRVVEQKNQQLEDANKAWAKVNTAREEFDEQVAEGLAVMRQKQRDLEASTDEYRKAVAADPGGTVPLTPGERSALRMLGASPSQQAAGRAVPGPNAPAGVRQTIRPHKP